MKKIFFALTAALLIISCKSSSDHNVSLFKGFVNPAREYKPWCYWWWLNGHVDKETMSADLESMKDLGFGGLLMFDARGYWDDDDHVKMPPPEIEFMSEEWIDNVCFAIRKADSLGLEFSMNLSNCGGSFKGPWELGEDSPKQLIYQSFPLKEGQTCVLPDSNPGLPCYQDVAMFAVRYDGDPLPGNKNWLVAGDGTYTMSASSGVRTDAAEGMKVVKAREVIELTGKDGNMTWDVPQGQWMLLRFGWSTIPGFEYDVDVLDPAAVKRHIERIVGPLKERVGDLFGKTLTHFYSVSWEGSVPTWSPAFEEDFKKFKGYDLRPVMPMLAGFEIGGDGALDHFMQDYRKARNDMFRVNFYGTMKEMTHSYGLEMVSECGGPWKRNPAIFQEADQQEFLSVNDMPQGEFWIDGRFHTRGVASTAHMYGLRRASAEAFTHMTYHWSVYPFLLKKLGDQAFVDGINHFTWHTFTCSPERFGVPGGEYFAGSHINRNVTWQKEAGPFVRYLARCQYLLQQGLPVVDIAVWCGDRVYQHWGHYRDKPYDASSLRLPDGYNSDIMNTDVLLNRAKAEKGRIVLPDGMTYRALVIDPEFPDACTEEVLSKIEELRLAGVPVFNASDKIEMPFPADFEGGGGCTHRKAGNTDIYFVTGEGETSLTLRAKGKVQVWDPVTGTSEDLSAERTSDGRTRIRLHMPEHGSAFILFNAADRTVPGPYSALLPETQSASGTSTVIPGPWNVSFRYHGLDAAPPGDRVWDQLEDLSTDQDEEIRFFSGTVTLRTSIELSAAQAQSVKYLSLGKVSEGVAHLYINGEDCGTIWTSPWSTPVEGKMKEGTNEITVEFTNTWRNRLIGDCSLPEGDRITKSGLHYYQAPRQNIRGLGNRPTIYSGYTAFDPLSQNGVLGPIILK